MSAESVPARAQNVVIISASVGAGHDAAAWAWAERLVDAGHRVTVTDLGEIVPAWVPKMLQSSYRAALFKAGWTWDVVFHVTSTKTAIRVVDRLLDRYAQQTARSIPAGTDVVLSTYPIAARVLGRARRVGLAARLVTFCTDSSVHPLWITRHSDATLVLHAEAARQARALSARGVTISGPLVPRRFRPARAGEVAQARRDFGLPATGRLALVMAGSWGVGEIEQAAADVEASGAVRAVVACGHNEELRQRLLTRGVGIPLGWIDQMHRLLHAMDVVVENAGGMSALESRACGIPVITYRPIPGHGMANAVAAHRSGFSRRVNSPEELTAALLAQLRPVATMTAGEPLDLLLGPTSRVARW